MRAWSGSRLVELAALAGLAFIALPGFEAGPVRSQPARILKLVVPIGPGSGLDLMARLIAEQIGRTQAVVTIVENRPGAAQVIATEAVANAPADGNTVLFMASPFVINPHVRRVTYDPLTSFEPVCNLASQPQFIVVNRASPYRTLDDLLSAARARPHSLTLASFGPASPAHIAFEMLKQSAGVDMTFVPYSSIPPTINAVLGDQVTAAMVGYAEAADHFRAGTLRPLVTVSHSRVDTVPDVPTIAEAGYKDAELDLWFGTVVPAKTANQTIVQLASWFTAAMQAPDVKTKLATQAFHPINLCGAPFGAFLREQNDMFVRIIRHAHIAAE